MFEHLSLRGKSIHPALFLAPMAGITHSAFRRLIAEFGGYGVLFTEMLSGKSLLHENIHTSPYIKKREPEGHVIYQLLLNGNEDIRAIIRKISSCSPFGIDLNLGCPAPKVRKLCAGGALFSDSKELNRILQTLRSNYNGVLTIKCRLGDESEQWKNTFCEKLRIFKNNQIDALFIHPRFSGDKLKRRARWELFPWIANQTDIPIIANGDILSPSQIQVHKHLFSPCAGLMLGRIAVVKPWIFRDFIRNLTSPVSEEEVEPVDYAVVWEAFFNYTLQDFPPEKAFGRIKEFTAYFARNFFFGHALYSAVQSSQSLESIYSAAMNFLNDTPRISPNPSVAGI